MKYHKLRAGEATGTYVMESPVTEADILRMAQQFASKRLTKGRLLADPKHVFSHLQTLFQHPEHEIFALLLLDDKHRLIGFRELFRGTLDSASVYPREVVKIALEHNAAAVILVHNHPSGDPEPSNADRHLTTTLKDALNMVGTRTLDHIVVGSEGCVSLAERGTYEGDGDRNAKTADHTARIRRHHHRLCGGGATDDFAGAFSVVADSSTVGLLDLQPTSER